MSMFVTLHEHLEGSAISIGIFGCWRCLLGLTEPAKIYIIFICSTSDDCEILKWTISKLCVSIAFNLNNHNYLCEDLALCMQCVRT